MGPRVRSLSLEGQTGARGSPVESGGARGEKRRAVNVRMLVVTAIGLGVLVPAAYFWHDYQVRRNAGALLDRVSESENGLRGELVQIGFARRLQLGFAARLDRQAAQAVHDNHDNFCLGRNTQFFQQFEIQSVLLGRVL